MKSARDMFEDLGYEFNDYSDEKNKDDNLYAVYVYEIREFLKYSPRVLYKEVAFFPNSKKVEIYVNDKFNNIKDCLWSIKELQAINRQVNELGWNDTTVNFDVKLDGKKVMEVMRGGNRKD